MDGRFLGRLLGGLLSIVLFYGVLLFLPAGTLHWWREWVLLGVSVACAMATLMLLRTHEALLAERYKPPIQPGQPAADRVLTLLLLLTYVGQIIFIPLDVFRLRLLPPPPDAVAALGLALFIGGWTLMAVALRTNAFAAPVVRHQEERRQTVIDTGVYGVVRHPMYAGALPLFLGMPLWLQSTAGVLLGLLPFAVIVARIFVEERLLRRALPGYAAYARRVRFRLIPGVW